MCKKQRTLETKLMKAILLGSFFLFVNVIDDVVILGGSQIIAPYTPAPTLVRTVVPGTYSSIISPFCVAPLSIFVFGAIRKRKSQKQNAN